MCTAQYVSRLHTDSIDCRAISYALDPATARTHNAFVLLHLRLKIRARGGKPKDETLNISQCLQQILCIVSAHGLKCKCPFSKSPRQDASRNRSFEQDIKQCCHLVND